MNSLTPRVKPSEVKAFSTYERIVNLLRSSLRSSCYLTGGTRNGSRSRFIVVVTLSLLDVYIMSSWRRWQSLLRTISTGWKRPRGGMGVVPTFHKNNIKNNNKNHNFFQQPEQEEQQGLRTTTTRTRPICATKTTVYTCGLATRNHLHHRDHHSHRAYSSSCVYDNSLYHYRGDATTTTTTPTNGRLVPTCLSSLAATSISSDNEDNTTLKTDDSPNSKDTVIRRRQTAITFTTTERETWENDPTMTTTSTTTTTTTTHSSPPSPSTPQRHQRQNQQQNQQHENQPQVTSSVCAFAANSTFETCRDTPLPPPLPKPKFTFLRRVLNDPNKKRDVNDQNSGCCVALDSREGRKRLLRSLQQETARSYFALQAHVCNQSEPTYCGVTTLLVILNAFAVDPLRRWKGGWRYFGNEDVLLHTCPCLEPQRILRTGLTLPQFAQLAACQGLSVQTKRPNGIVNSRSHHSGNVMNSHSNNDNSTATTTNTSAKLTLEDFREDVIDVLTTRAGTSTTTDKDELGDDNNNNNDDDDDEDDNRLTCLLVASYARSSLGQTGDGHFSPIAAYDATTDSVLILDVARFKYPSYWVQLKELYHAMEYPLDPVTHVSRGWFVLMPPPLSAIYQGSVIYKEAKRPVQQIPAFDEVPHCPGHIIKVEYCPNNINKNKDHDHPHENQQQQQPKP